MRLERLNPAQRSAVLHARGPLLVLAGAGTGKTRVITFRIAQLISRGTPPERILAVTFTNKAAREMKQRTMALLGSRRRKGNGSPEISTFHSLCVRILRRQIHRLGYPQNFSIYDRSDQETLARGALRDIRVDRDTVQPAELLARVSAWKNRGIRPETAQALALDHPKDPERATLSALAYQKYECTLRSHGALDFDDLLLVTEDLLRDWPAVRKEEASRFDQILVDEYQDTNALQYRILHCLAEGHRNLCVVGDDDQSIYGFRGAEVEHILRFERDWPGAKVVKLEENYRSMAPILELANTLVSHNSHRHDKVLQASRRGGQSPRFLRFEDESGEALGVTGLVRTLLDSTDPPPPRPSDIAILVRTNEQTRGFETELRRARIPYVLVGGKSFYDRKEIKDLLAYLRILANPLDEVSLLRALHTPPRGIGPGSVQTLLGQAVAGGVSLYQILSNPDLHPQLPTAVGPKIRDFLGLLERLQALLQQVPLEELVKELLRAIDYRSELERTYKTAADVESRWQGVEELVNAAFTYRSRTPNATLVGFLEECSLTDRDSPGDSSNSDEAPAAVQLMTLHSAKGLEFSHVFLVGVEEGILPHHRSVLAEDGHTAIEEERRLCYVGVTRAKETLTLTYARARTKWGKPQPSVVSRFLLEMRGETERAQRAAQIAQEQLGKASRSPSLAPPADQSKRRSSASSRASSSSPAGAAGSAGVGDAETAPRRRHRKSKTTAPAAVMAKKPQPSRAAPSRGTRSGTARKRGP